MAGAISVSRNSVIGRRNFSVLPAVQTLDLVYMQTDIDCHFGLNTCSHGVKTEVKQVDDNDSWLFIENELLHIELSDFCNYR